MRGAAIAAGTTARFDSEKSYTGMVGLRALWLGWLATWATYRSEVKQAIDLGDGPLCLFATSGAWSGTRRRSGSPRPDSTVQVPSNGTDLAARDAIYRLLSVLAPSSSSRSRIEHSRA